MLTHLFHLTLFTIVSGIFSYAVFKRLRLVSKAQSVGPLASLEARLRSVLLNVVFQYKLFQHPLRGIMHSFIFYGFISYSLHTVSQIIAGNMWSIFFAQGTDPYQFRVTDYMNLGLLPDGKTGALFFLVLLGLMALTVFWMNSFRIGKKIHWRTSPLVQWFFILLLGIEFTSIFLLANTSGTHFHESVVQYFSLLVLIGLGFFAYRRWIRRSEELDLPSVQSAIVLLLIAVLMISTLVGHSAQSFLNGSHSNWMDRLVSVILAQVGFPFEGSGLGTAEAIRNFSWWSHLFTVYSFMIYVPISKHAHLIFAPINYFLIRNRPLGQMSMMDLESEDAVWGAANLSELPWTSLLDGLSCIECGRCTVECPAHRTGKPLDPKKIMVDVKHAMMEYQGELLKSSNSSSGSSEPVPSKIIGTPFITEEELWGCTSCNACVEACPVGNNQLDAIMEMRRNLVLSESKFPPELQTAFENMESQSNPWGIGAHSRTDWCSDLDLKTMEEQKEADVLYWVGCAASFDERNKKIARSFVSIMKEAGVNFAILGNEEKCTGDSARRGGNEYLYQTLAKANVETLNRHKFQKIVTACPHCFNTLKNEYPQMGGSYNVQHHSDFIDDLLKKKKIQIDPKKQEKMKSRRAVFHDSCYLGRYNEIFEEPRNLIRKATGMDLAEAEDHHRKSLCCGAGGAQMWMEEKYDRVNGTRSQQLIDTGADTIATSCPFCITMVSDGVKSKGLSEDIRVMDVAEITAVSMKGGTEQALPLGGFQDKR